MIMFCKCQNLSWVLALMATKTKWRPTRSLKSMKIAVKLLCFMRMAATTKCLLMSNYQHTEPSPAGEKCQTNSLMFSPIAWDPPIILTAIPDFSAFPNSHLTCSNVLLINLLPCSTTQTLLNFPIFINPMKILTQGIMNKGRIKDRIWTIIMGTIKSLNMGDRDKIWEKCKKWAILIFLAVGECNSQDAGLLIDQECKVDQLWVTLMIGMLPCKFPIITS